MLKKQLISGGVRNSAALRALPRLRLGHITADKRLRCYTPTPKLPSATSFIRGTLAVIRENGIPRI